MAASKNPLKEQEVLSLKPHGLYSYPNQFSAVPQGAMLEGTNVVLDRPNVLEQRRGFSPYGGVFATNQNKLFSYQDRLIVAYDHKLAHDSDGNGTWTDYTGTYDEPSGAIRIHSVAANKNIYFTTSTGLQKLDSVSGDITFSGAPAGLDGSGTTSGSGWFANTTQVAYRILFGYTDANNNLVLGAPSQRIVVSNNTGGATNVALTFTLPDGLTESWVYQIYRSPQSADLNTEPNDECALVFTGNPTMSDLSNGYVTVTDNVPDSLKGEFIYTASSQQGILQSNYQAPLSTDATVFKDFVFLANTTSKQELFLTLVSVSGSGLVVNDTVTIDSVVYTAKGTENIAAGEFKVFTGGTPAQNITDTANSLVRVINRYTSNTTVYAYYRSGYADLPGRIVLSERTIGSGAFDTVSSRAGAFVPDIGTTTATSASDPAFFGKNRVSISKYQQPEAYPTVNNLPLGSASAAILRIIALRDYVLVFKEDGIYQIAGTDTSSFQVQEVDKTTVLKGIETAVALNNKVFMFTNQTVVSVTVNEGVILKSQPILRDLLELSSPLFPDFDAVSFGLAYESDNKYLLGTVSTLEDSLVSQVYVYNYLTDSWTTWQLPITVSSGIVNPTDNKLYFASSDVDSEFVYKERKNYNQSDFADESYDVFIDAFSGINLTLNDTSNLLAGYSISQGFSTAVIEEIIDGTHIIVDKEFVWSVDAATVYVPILVTVRFVPESFGNPGIVKHFKEVHSIFTKANFSSLNLGFYTDFNNTPEHVILIPKASDGWGIPAWGEFPWGSGGPEAQVIRQYVPLKQRRGHWLNLTIDYASALTNFALDGFALFHGEMSQKFH